MEYLIVGVVALGASALTFFSGFGLGTLLLPAFLLFFPAEQAVALTGVVHFLNNLFKLALVGRQASPGVVLRFGLPAVAAAFVGAWVLGFTMDLPPILRYAAFGREVALLPVGLVMGLLIAAFGVLELHPKAQAWEVPVRYLPWGGVLSGFFGGLSGHQGALRSAFLARAGLTPGAFIATGVVIACLIDVTRLSVYAGHLAAGTLGANLPLLLTATGAAWAGALAGQRYVRKVTMAGVRRVVGVVLMAIAAGLISGLL